MSFGGGSGGDINYVITVEDSDAIQKLPNVTKALKDTGTAGQQATQQLQQMPTALNNIAAEGDKVLTSQQKINQAMKEGKLSADTLALSQKGFGSVLKDSILGISQAVTGVIGLIQQYTQLERAQVKLKQTQLTEIAQRNKITELVKKHAQAVKEYGANSNEALKIESDLNALQAKHSITVQRIDLMQDSLNQRMADFAVNILPNLIQTGAGLADTILNIKKWNDARASVAAVTGATNGLSMSMNRLKIATGIGIALVAIELAAQAVANNFMGLRDWLDETYNSLVKLAPAFKPVIDALYTVGEFMTALFTGDFDKLGKLLGGQVAQGATAAAAGVDDLTESTTEAGDAAKKAKEDFAAFQKVSTELIVEASKGDKKAQRDFLKTLGIKGDEKEKVRDVLDAVEDATEEMDQAASKLEALEGFSILEKLGFDIPDEVIKDIQNTLDSDLRDILEGKNDPFNKLADILEESPNKEKYGETLQKWIAENPELYEALQMVNPRLASAIDSYVAKFGITAQTALDTVKLELPDNMIEIDPNTLGKNVQDALGITGAPKVGEGFKVAETDWFLPLRTSIDKAAGNLPAQIQAIMDKHPILKDVDILAAGDPAQDVLTPTEAATWFKDNVMPTIQAGWEIMRKEYNNYAVDNPLLRTSDEIVNAIGDPKVLTLQDAADWFEDNIMPTIQGGWDAIRPIYNNYAQDNPLLRTSDEIVNAIGDPKVLQLQDAVVWFEDYVLPQIEGAWDAVRKVYDNYAGDNKILQTSDEIVSNIGEPDVLTLEDASKWFTDYVYKPIKGAWDSIIDSITGYIEEHSIQGAVKDGIEHPSEDISPGSLGSEVRKVLGIPDVTEKFDPKTRTFKPISFDVPTIINPIISYKTASGAASRFGTSAPTSLIDYARNRIMQERIGQTAKPLEVQTDVQVGVNKINFMVNPGYSAAAGAGVGGLFDVIVKALGAQPPVIGGPLFQNPWRSTTTPTTPQTTMGRTVGTDALAQMRAQLAKGGGGAPAGDIAVQAAKAQKALANLANQGANSMRILANAILRNTSNLMGNFTTIAKVSAVAQKALANLAIQGGNSMRILANLILKNTGNLLANFTNINIAAQASQTALANLANQGSNSFSILAKASSKNVKGMMNNLNNGYESAGHLQTGLANLANEGADSLAALAKASSKSMNGLINNVEAAEKAVAGLQKKINALKSKTIVLTTINRTISIRAQHGFHGMVSGPTSFLAGEAGPEYVSVTPMNQVGRASSGGPGRSGGGNITVNLTNIVADKEITRTFRRELGKELYRFGPT